MSVAGAFFNPWRFTGWGFVTILLLTSAIAMQFVADWNWGPGDFDIAAILIGGVGLGWSGSRACSYAAVMDRSPGSKVH